QDIVGFECVIAFQFATPIASLVLLGEEELTRGISSRYYAALEIVNFAETHLRGDRRTPRDILHAVHSAGAPAGALAMASTISGGSPKRTFSGMTSTSRRLSKPWVERNSTTSYTNNSGSVAPAVWAIMLYSSRNSCGMWRQF